MRLLVIHNTYRESGGEDIVVDQELDLLRRRGHDVLPVIFNNSAIGSALDRAAVTLRVGMNSASAERLATAVSAFRPDIAHVHNFFPLVSPGALEVVVRSGVPIVQTLHNFRVVCPGALLLREGRPCEDCVGASRWPAVRALSRVGRRRVPLCGRPSPAPRHACRFNAVREIAVSCGRF
jgi:glycosyltransferase involved in cell wall biosynthesis